MTLSTGTKLAHYEISSQLGKGGMGEVYKAKDQKLGRDVAIKVLPEEFAKDADRVARFQREAKLLASLNHPNIAAIHGLEESDGTHFLVLELIEGDTLADRLKRGAIPVEESLKLALQIAEALEAAHENGVIHRDLKPANIKVTPDGKVKVLDFGLAKAFTGDQVEVDLSQSPTLSAAATRQGVILGTAAYMSPEQAKGKPVDKKTDIWAFGAVLFEMLTGKPVFREEDVTEILASVVKASVNLDLLPAKLHTKIHEVCSRCLQKDLRKRYADISDVRYEIEQVLADPGGVFAGAAPVEDSGKKQHIGKLWIAALIAVTAICVGFAVWHLKPGTDSRAVNKLSIALPPDQQLIRLGISLLAFSPDGTKLAYAASKEGSRQIYIRPMGDFEATPIKGTEGGANPFFSPDGQSVGFTNPIGDKPRKVPIQGGAPVPIADVYQVQGISWGKNGAIAMAQVYGQGGIYQIPESGGDITAITEHGSESLSHRWPHWLPGGKALLYTAWNRKAEEDRIMLHLMETGEQKELIRGGTDGRYVPTGHIVYAKQGNLFAVPFDLERLEVDGEAVQILEGVMQSTEGIAQYSFSDQGSLAYIPGSLGMVLDRELVWVDRDGREQTLGIPPGPYQFARLSPNQEQIALTFYGANDEIRIYDIPTQRLNPLTLKGRNNNPKWTPDGKHLTFRSDQGGTGFLDLYQMPMDGIGGLQCLDESKYDKAPLGWSPDGKFLLYVRYHPMRSADLWILPFENGGEPYPLLENPWTEWGGSFSPDGRWIAYSSNETGQTEICVIPFPGPGRSERVSTNGGGSPVWGEQNEIFYQSENRIIAVKCEANPTFKVVSSKPLFENTGTYYLYWGFDVTPDGSRFLVEKPTEQEQAPRQINVILNWFEELKKRVPVE